MKNKFWLLVFSCWLLVSSAHAKSELAIETFTLKNGLEVIVIPNHRVPAVSHTIWYKVGAADDPVGKSGLAHYHEHVMFLGTKKYKSGEYSNIIARNGGQHNAFTGHDATAYYINIAKENLPLAMEMEADRMGELTASNEAMEKEKQVIIEERRLRVDNNPDALLSEQMDAALFRNHPYRMPVIGWQHEMNNLTKQDVIDFHKKYYHPNNAILIISGDVTASEVKPLAEKYYGNLKKAEIPLRKWNEEPPQRGARRISMRHEQISQPEIARAYATSSLNYGKKDQGLPLLILSQVLGGGKTSRLYKSLITEQKLAAAVDVGINSFTIGPAEFGIEVIPEQGVEPEKLEAAMDKELAKFLAEGLTDEELARAKTLLKAETIFARDGLSGVAQIMGWLRMIGKDSNYFSSIPKLVDKITKDAVLEAAKDTLKLEQSVTALLLPEIRSQKEEK